MLGTIELRDQEKLVRDIIRIHTTDDLNAVELGQFFIGFDEMYRIFQFFSFIEVDELFARIISQIDSYYDISSAEHIFDNFDEINDLLERVLIFVRTDHSYNLELNQVQKLKKVIATKYHSQGELLLKEQLIRITKRYFTSKGMRISDTIWDKMSLIEKYEFSRYVGSAKRISLSKESIHYCTNLFPFQLLLKRINYNSPGSIDFLGVGKVLEVLKDFILSLKDYNSDNERKRLENELLKQDVLIKKQDVLEKRINNMDKFLEMRKKAIELSESSIIEVFDLIEDNEDSMKKLSEKIEKIEIVSEDES